jgi:hypothetical protein
MRVWNLRRLPDLFLCFTIKNVKRAPSRNYNSNNDDDIITPAWNETFSNEWRGTIMKVLLLLLASGLAYITVPLRAQEEEKVTIDKLSAEELKSLKEARQAFAEAHRHLQAVEKTIQQLHGEAANGYPGDAMVHCVRTMVELRGEFVIVSKTDWCGSLTGIPLYGSSNIGTVLVPDGTVPGVKRLFKRTVDDPLNSTSSDVKEHK